MYWIRNMEFPIGGQFEPTVYLARLLRYWASNVMVSRLWSFGVQPMLKTEKLTAHASYHVTYRKRVKTTTYLEFTTPICLFTMTLLGGSDEE